MPRPPRVEFEGAVYHITGHGNDENVVFRDSTDRRRYLRLLARLPDRTAVGILAYALMTTHVHLVVQTPRPNVSETVQWLHGRYAALFNHRTGRHGHLFGGRFNSRIVDSDAYLLEVTRYAHLNPVRAGVVTRPEDYPWSSYRKYLGLDDRAPADPMPVLKLIAPGGSSRVEEYRRFVEEPLAVRLRRFPPDTPAWEDAALGAVVDAIGVTRADVLGRCAPQVRIPVISLLYNTLGLPIERVASILGMQAASVARALRKGEAFHLNSAIAGQIAAARDVLTAGAPHGKIPSGAAG